MTKRKLSAVLIFLSTAFTGLYAESLSDFLEGWIQNDRDLKTAAISLQKSQITNEKTLIQNGFNITLSSGNMTFKTVSGVGVFTLTPNVTASIPQARNLSLSAETDISISSESNLENATLKAGINLIDTDKDKRNITFKKSARSLLEAERTLETKVLSSEKSFYTEIKSLLKIWESIISSKNNLYTEKISFEKIKAQGFSESSSSYRLAQMKVQNNEHSIEMSVRELNHNFEIFLLKCGFENHQQLDFEQFISILETGLPENSILTFDDFDKSSYKQIENAVWTKEINTLSRKAEKNYSLSANAGYTFNNTTTKTSNGKPSDTINAGLSSNVLGMNLNAGVSIPVNPGATPAFTAGISFSPNTLKLQKLSEKEYLLDEESEDISIETAIHNYNLAATDKQKTAEDLKWTKATTEENLTMYTKIEKDMAYYYKMGIITESEYLSSKNTMEKYKIEKTMNLLEITISNCETRSLFYSDKKN